MEEEEFYNILNIVRTMNLTGVIQALVITRTENYIREKTAVEFWSCFQKPLDSKDGFLKFYKAVELLYNCYAAFSHIMIKLDLLRKYADVKQPIYNEKSAVDALKLIIRSILLSQLPVSHKTIIENFYETALRKEENKNNESMDEMCGVCVLTVTECTCLHNFYETNRYCPFCRFELVLFIC